MISDWEKEELFDFGIEYFKCSVKEFLDKLKSTERISYVLAGPKRCASCFAFRKI